GILAAANALALDFIPLFEERYDLIIPNEFSDSTLLTPLFDLLASLQFREEVHAIPGYDTREMGKLVASFS
ncbi:MAG: molybdopterin biosynthesis protein, partial [Proteobacteria bacterium]|nr:molybdopterin biosynthesis protein [Pseudomonadota bacterium]